MTKLQLDKKLFEIGRELVATGDYKKASKKLKQLCTKVSKTNLVSERDDTYGYQKSKELFGRGSVYY